MAHLLVTDRAELEAFLTSSFPVAFAETGDKTQLATVALVARCSSWSAC
jgi:putative Ca2+/H+ antiporter (TMEM165/GDT1 family)